VELRLREPVASVEPGGVALASGGWLPADVVVTSVGVRPAVAWLEGSAVALGNGVLVDEQLRASVPGVWAVGDCMAFWSRRYQRRLRLEHWDGALRSPAAAAASLTGGAGRYDPVPYVWSEQFGQMIQYAGFPGGADRIAVRGDPAERRWAVFWLAGDVPVALLTVNSPRDLMQGRRLIEAGAGADAARLADPGVPVAQAASG
jgi:3-phenylpropionate/trans-cinnamate dioxygenase ferredoxin reductase subunit